MEASSSTPEKKKDDKQQRPTTEYAVLRKQAQSAPGDDERAGEVYTVVATDLAASSAKQAVALTAADEGDGTYIAVPSRSFRPLTLRTETVKKAVIE